MTWVINLDKEVKIKRVAHDTLELEIGGKKAKVLTEDLAAIVSEELPKDRAKDMLSAIDEKLVSKGKIRISVKAGRDMKAGDVMRATMDITRYIDDANALNAKKNEKNKGGILLPQFSAIRTNKAGFII